MGKRNGKADRPTIKRADIVFGFDELEEDESHGGLSHTAHGVAYDIWMEEDGTWRWSAEYRGCALEELLGKAAPTRWDEICYPWPLAGIDEGTRCDSALEAWLDMRSHVQASAWWQALDD